jgi:hypothetical protein
MLPDVDLNTIAFYKDGGHQIYRYRGNWVIAHHGIRIWFLLDVCRGTTMNYTRLDLSDETIGGSPYHQDENNGGGRLVTYNPINEQNIILFPPKLNISESGNRITYSYTLNGVYTEYSNSYILENGCTNSERNTNKNKKKKKKHVLTLYDGLEGMVSAMLPHCILTGADVFTNEVLDKTFLDNITSIKGGFKNKHKKRHGFEVHAPTRISCEDPCTRITRKDVVSLFTMGVDSFHTLYSNIDKITTILYVVGFDIKLSQESLVRKTIHTLKKVSKLYNKRLIVCYSPVRDIMKGIGFGWKKYFHGPALFHIVYGLATTVSLYTPSIDTRGNHNNVIRGSVFCLDHFYSSSFLSIQPMGDSSRVEKIRDIISWDKRCLMFLRVCLRSETGSYNCSVCEKCMRTLYQIHLLGYGVHASTFHHDCTNLYTCRKKYTSFKPKNYNDRLFLNEIRLLESVL